MFKSIALSIGLRYIRAKKRNHFVSFIAAASMLGIALGVAVLITVLSVMNGFDFEVQKRFFGMAPEMTVNHISGLKDWRSLRDTILKQPGYIGAAPFVGGQGLLTHHGLNRPVIATGIDPLLEATINKLPEYIISGRLDSLQSGEFNIIIGREIAEHLHVDLGDKVQLMVPEVSVTPAGVLPRFKSFTVSGIFDNGGGFGFNGSLVLLHLADAQTLLLMGDTVSGLKIRTNTIYDALRLTPQLQNTLPDELYVGNWTTQHGELFTALKLQKTMMFLVLLLIIFIAAFNLVTSLVMIVNEKQAEIAILRTLGAVPRTILAIFIIQGTLIGFIGTLLGLGLGLLLAFNATEIVTWIQTAFNLDLVSAYVYFIEYLPSKIELADIIKVCAASLIMSFFATLYPAWRASLTHPAEALRYE